MRHKKWIASLVLFLSPWIVLYVSSYFQVVPTELGGRPEKGDSVRLLDRNGVLLQEVRAGDGARAKWIPLGDAEWVAKALVAAEDARFYEHRGVDFRALARAFLQNITQARIVSGASTLTMQLARNHRPHKRTFLGKFSEMSLALAIERARTKDQILEDYINRVYFGPEIRGIGAACQSYFAEECKSLTLGQSAVLAGLVRGPSYYNLEKHAERAEARKKYVLKQMVDTAKISAEMAFLAEAEPVSLQTTRPVWISPHGLDACLQAARETHVDRGEVRCTFAARLQRIAEVSTLRAIRDLEGKNVTAAAVIVLDNQTREVLAYVGSPNYHNDEALGKNDGVRALRQPGSTLKPFVYELAMERLAMYPGTILPDVEYTSANSFRPKNYDKTFHGPVSLREALGNSLNVPAVVVADRLGPEVLLERLHALGFASLTRSAEHYGSALALGDGEVTLLELANAYATLAMKGKTRPPVLLAASAATEERTVMTQQAVLPVIDILQDKRARWASFREGNALEFDESVAAKTGTSKGYRDNWAVGFSSEVTVAVWAGNFDGSPMGEVSGVAGAGPLFHDVMEAALRDRRGASLELTKRDGLFERISICAKSGLRATADCPERRFEWITPELAASLPYDNVYRRVRIDRRNGLLVGSLGPTCPKGETTEKLVEDYPQELKAWAIGSKRLVLPEGVSPNCPGAAAESCDTVSIRSPETGASFAMDPENLNQAIELHIAAPQVTPKVELWVDDQLFPTPEKRVFWPLRPGHHRFKLKCQDKWSEAVEIDVAEVPR